ncbi:group II intron reverse transcriptase/maturase [Streptosporangium sp. NBC_01810]|uniref:group II intron reverse transcriptase/maturase n=1 Tax=Streptosporangium sp. NBC_01810 TaxID=2975951 RepID=UPI002DDADA6B|nr:group II intron reverse transcriptase/maturase [Streptosporangium sp. NBC_01810]WSA26946.1 group II intron reverse transcriptase/maturase [Streptosporangium sp. NBC_01810]WSA27132.1 group II intron reverse transcriptase/maturase [Streptosporangium sp. NBC_01810]WSA27820.1 group II intron reverse transcriptase/maturase [Streptosporangium sp. NBC_01810]WSA28601.1 group II intron reverse transcriptase/maturase [Streptosporangium sp. NBC_01810]WSA28827.1 group II intron reverse transcriptase/ma
MSAVLAIPAAVGPRVPRDPVRALQHVLYRAAKADPGRRFHALMDKVYRRDVLERGWVMVRSNNGAPGIDATTLADIEEYGIVRLLEELAAELRQGRYRPLPARRVMIPKPGLKDEYRPLSIPAVRDRIVQAAVKIVFEPVFEADMADCSFGFRPKRSAHDALQVLIEEQARGRRWVVETDIANCFSAIPHDELMRAIEERVCDQSLLKLLRVILRAGVMEDGQIRREVTGTPQGGVVSPVLCNVYLHRLDRAWDEADGVPARYADDAIVMCWSRGQAERALARLTELLAALGLEPKAAKTRIVHLEVGGEGLDFLGFHHRLVRSRGFNGKRPFVFLARWPSDRAMQHARDRIRDLTDGRRLLLRTEAITKEVNLFLRGWAGYFRYGHSARRFSKIREFAWMRLALFLSRKHRRSRSYGRGVLKRSLSDLGLISLYGIVVAPRAGKPWRERPNAGGERRR